MVFELTEQDKKFIYPIAKYIFYLENSTYLLESDLKETILYYFLEASDPDVDIDLNNIEASAEKIQKQVKQDAIKEEDDEDTMLDGILRMTTIYSKVSGLYAKARSNKIVAAGFSAFVGAAWMKYKNMLERATEVQQREIENRIIQKFKTLTGRVYNPKNPEDAKLVAKYTRKLRFKWVQKYQKSEVKKLLASERLWDRVKGRLRQIWMKVSPSNVSEKLADLIEASIDLAKRHPYLTVFSVAMIIGLIIFSIFKWNTIKKWFKAFIRIITAPFRYFWKGIRWLFSKFGLVKKQENYQFV